EPAYDTAVAKEVAGRPAADLREVHRTEHRYSLFTNRIVLHPALIVEDHCRPVLRVECRPARQLWSVWITLSRKRNPGAADLVGQSRRIRTVFRQACGLHSIEREWNLYGMR